MNRAGRRAQWRARNRANDAPVPDRAVTRDAAGRRPDVVNVSIGTLVLEGYRQSDRHAIGEAMQAELRALIADQGVPETFRAPRTISRFRAPAIATGPASSPSAIGAAVAGAVYRGGRA